MNLNTNNINIIIKHLIYNEKRNKSSNKIINSEYIINKIIKPKNQNNLYLDSN